MSEAGDVEPTARARGYGFDFDQYVAAGSLGIPGRLTDPQVGEACANVIAGCRCHRKGVGTQVIDPAVEEVRERLARGYSFVVLGSDVFALWQWSDRMRTLINAFRRAAPEQ